MRIITGSAKGIRLKTLEGNNTRPTAERVKEAVFSMLQFDIEGRRVLDLFAGSGQMALEALSRGAANATLVDKAKEAIAIIKDNAQKTRFFDRCRIYQSDYLGFLKKGSDEAFDIVFLDPPYDSNAYAPALNGLMDGNFLKASSMIICESRDDSVFDESVAAKFSVVKQVRYGTALVTLLQPNSQEK